MTALTQDRNTVRRDGEARALPVAAATILYAGGIVAVGAAGFAVKGATATGLKAVGVAEERADNSTGANGAINVSVRKDGVFLFANSAAADQITRADIGATCYIVDDQTVAKTDGTGTRSAAGQVFDVDADGVWVRFV